jgi:hypothetical protein
MLELYYTKVTKAILRLNQIEQRYFCSNCCNRSLIITTDDFKTLFIIYQAITVRTDPYNRFNEINFFCINFIQDLLENFPLLTVVTDLTSVITVNLARISIT